MEYGWVGWRVEKMGFLWGSTVVHGEMERCEEE